jgi:hypothetical protein
VAPILRVEDQARVLVEDVVVVAHELPDEVLGSLVSLDDVLLDPREPAAVTRLRFVEEPVELLLERGHLGLEEQHPLRIQAAQLDLDGPPAQLG